MTLPSTGSISAAQIIAETGISPLVIPSAVIRTLVAKPAGSIVWPTDFYGQTNGGSCTLTDTNQINTVAGTATFNSQAIGGQARTRQIFVIARWACSSDAIDTTITSATCGGNAMAAAVQNAQNGTSTLSNYGCAILTCNSFFPSGTTANIVISFSNGTVRTCYIAVFRLTGLITVTPTDTATAFDELLSIGTVNAASTLNVAAGGVIFIASIASAATSVSAIAHAGATEVQDIAGIQNDRVGACMQTGFSLINNRPVGASATVNPAGRMRLCAASFRLA